MGREGLDGVAIYNPEGKLIGIGSLQLERERDGKAEHVNMIVAAAWMPWLFLAVEQLWDPWAWLQHSKPQRETRDRNTREVNTLRNFHAGDKVRSQGASNSA